jgi:hypothetical protein
MAPNGALFGWLFGELPDVSAFPKALLDKAQSLLSFPLNAGNVFTLVLDVAVDRLGLTWDNFLNVLKEVVQAANVPLAAVQNGLAQALGVADLFAANCGSRKPHPLDG